MPVERTLRENGRLKQLVFSADHVRAHAERMVESNLVPSWRKDPTYNLRRTKKT